MDNQETSSPGETRKLEITPKTAEQIRNVVVQSAFVPDATSEMIRGVTRLEKAGFDSDGNPRQEAFLAETTTGLDVVVNRDPNTGTPRPDWFIPHERGFYLEGCFEEKSRRIMTPDGSFRVSVYTGPDRFNQTMATLGRKSGEDTFRLVPTEVGKFTPEFYAESAAQLQIPIARHTEEYVIHDLKLNDHIQEWWAMPPEIALHLQKRATQALESGIETREARINEFAEGIDLLAEFSKDIVPKFADWLDSEWEESESADERVEQAMDFIKNFADPLGNEDGNKSYQRHIRDGSIALVKTGLLENFSVKTDGYGRSIGIKFPLGADGKVDEHSSELQRAKHGMSLLAGAYARNVVNMLSLAGDRQGVTERADPRRGEVIGKLMAKLESSAVAAFINQHHSLN